MAKLKNEVLQNTVTGEAPMSVVDTMTELERSTIAAKVALEAAKEVRESIDVRIRAANALIEEADTERRAFTAQVSAGEDVADEVLTAALQKSEVAKERLAALREAIPGAQQSFNIAARELLRVLTVELRLRAGQTVRRRAWLQEQMALNDARLKDIEFAGSWADPGLVEQALAKHARLPELDDALTAAAE